MKNNYVNKTGLVNSFIIMVFMISVSIAKSQTIADTFDISDIPTNLGAYSQTCNGPLTRLSITLPAGGPWNVNSVSISYTMTAQGGGFKSHQRSYVRCQTTATSEPAVYEGSGNTGGVQVYNRTGVTIANGSYSAGTTLHFEMRAWRTAVGSGCGSANNRVDNFSWILTVYYSQIPDEGSVGIGTTTPATSAILDLTSTTQAFLPPRMTTNQRDAIASPQMGMMIINITTQNLEIYLTGWSAINSSSPALKKLLGGSLADTARSIQQTTDGGFIVAGSSFSSNTGTLAGLMNNGQSDYWIIRLNSSGGIVWQKLLGGTLNDAAKSIQQTSDGGFIVGGHSYSSNTGTLAGVTNHGGADNWILKLDANGNTLWQKLRGGNDDDFLHDIRQTSDGGYIVTGVSLSTHTGDLLDLATNGIFDSWIYKTDSNGNIVWQKLYGGTNSDYLVSIQQTTDGGYICAGYTGSSNSGTLTGTTNNGVIDGWILKLDNLGNMFWQKVYGGSLYDALISIQQTTEGGYIVSGFAYSGNNGTFLGYNNNGVSDYWIMKLDDSGVITWQRLWGGVGAEVSHSIKQTSDGGFIVAGFSQSNNGTLAGLINNGSADYWILRLDNSGIILWQRLYGGSVNEIAYSIQQISGGGFIIAGQSASSNTGTLLGLSNNGGDDYWILKVDASGNPF
jgi:hypothetical protein